MLKERLKLITNIMVEHVNNHINDLEKKIRKERDNKMKWVEKRKLEEEKALETLVGEMEELGWEKSPDTKGRYATNCIQFKKGENWIVIEWNEFITFENNLTVNGYVLIAITKYLQAVKL